MNTLTEKFNEVEYFSDVAQIRHLIAKMEKAHNLVDEVAVDKRYGTVNPICGKIEADGAFGLAYSFGYPEYLYTPFGQIKIDSAEHNSANDAEKMKLLDELKNIFGLVETEPAWGTNPGEIGARYTITKLPWKANQQLPAIYKKAWGYLNTQSQVSLLRHIDQVYEKVNNRFFENGHPELMIQAPKKKRVLNETFKALNAAIIGKDL